MARLAGDFTRAVNHFQAGRYRQAEKICRQILKRNPAHKAALEICGLIALQQRAWTRARSLLGRLLERDPDNASAQCNMGLACLELGEVDSAMQHCLCAVRLVPKDVDANNNLGRVYQAQGQMEKSLACYLTALDSAPWNPLLLVNAGAVCQQLGQSESAVTYYHRALQVVPEFAEAHSNLGVLLLDQGQYQQALRHFEQALQQKETADLHNHIGLTRMALEQLDLAREQFSRALALEPGHQDALFNWAWFEEYHNNIKLASQVSDRCQGNDSGHVGLLVLRSALARRKQDFVTALSVLEQLDSNAMIGGTDQVLYLFEKGTVLDRLGRYAEAFAIFEEANETKNRLLVDDFDEAADIRWCNQLQVAFSAANERLHWQTLATSSVQGPDPQLRPLFIVGFPRSGTSLLTQMLGRHTRVSLTGEMPGILDLVGGGCEEILGSDLPYPDCLFDPAQPLTSVQVQQLRDHYYATLPQTGESDGSGAWLIDKMPHNALHLGLIRLLFPHAPVIHISRHPLDACLSAYFANFELHRYTASLQITARHYQRMMDLIDYYQQNTQCAVREIRYQDLVTDPQETLHSLLEYVGLPWQEDCVRPELSTVHVKTRSYAQVNEAIHSDSVNRYRHYRSQLAGIVEWVRPAIQRYGYDLR